MGEQAGELQGATWTSLECDNDMTTTIVDKKHIKNIQIHHIQLLQED